MRINGARYGKELCKQHTHGLKAFPSGSKTEAPTTSKPPLKDDDDDEDHKQQTFTMPGTVLRLKITITFVQHSYNTTACSYYQQDFLSKKLLLLYPTRQTLSSSITSPMDLPVKIPSIA